MDKRSIKNTIEYQENKIKLLSMIRHAHADIKNIQISLHAYSPNVIYEIFGKDKNDFSIAKRIRINHMLINKNDRHDRLFYS
jgi:hypothetical protein